MVAPFSLVCSAASSWVRAASLAATACSRSARSSGGLLRHTPDSCAALAAATARSMCSVVPLATVATSSPVAGLRISYRSGASTHSPLMKSG